MGFFEHLEEFRKRLIVCLIAIFVAFLLCWSWAPQIFEILARPVRRVLPPGQNLSYTTLTEPFLMYFRVALFAGLIAASPVILWQLWLFVAPALYRREKRYVLPFILAGSLLLPRRVRVRLLRGVSLWWWDSSSASGRTSTPSSPSTSIWRPRSRSSSGSGICFEMPILIFFLARMGVVSERWLLSKFKYAVLIIFIIAAIITPTPDVATQCVFAVPMILALPAGDRRRLDVRTA